MDTRYTIDKSTFLEQGGSLRIVRWAKNLGLDASGDKQLLEVDLGERPHQMANSTATGDGLLSNGQLGADVIRLNAGDGFVPHTHPGDHLLIIIGGQGTITYGGHIYPTDAGQIYLIEGAVPHAVGAITDHVILAVGSPHKPVESTERMEIVEYHAVTTQINELHCLICDLTATLPAYLHDAGCSHCPCQACQSLSAG